MDDLFKIYIEQLRDGQERKIDESFPPDFLDIHERDLEFKKNVKVKGHAYIAEDELVLHWSIWTEALIACSICNEKVPIEIKLEDFYHSEPISDIKGGIFNFKDLLRETILLEVPPFAECNHGNCPKRKEVSQYLKDPSKDQTDQKDGYKPFADLDWE
jgi:uncharacterized metal-binding protein YceD (DUF177 family)